MKLFTKISPIVLAIVLTLGSLPARAECSRGDVRAMFHSITVFSGVHRARSIESHMTEQVFGLIGVPCQYRLFVGEPLDSEEPPPIQTFIAGQTFLGGTGLLWDYPNLGFSRKQAIEDILLYDEHVYLMPTDSEWNYDLDELLQHEETLMTTNMRNSVILPFGLSVSRQIGMIKELPVGRYVSLHTTSYPGNPELLAMHPDDPDWTFYFEPYEATSVVFLDIVP